MKETGKNEKRPRRIESLLLGIAGGIFLVSGVWLWRMWSGYEAGKREYARLEAMAVRERQTGEDAEVGDEGGSAAGETAGSGRTEISDDSLVPLGTYRLKEIDFESLQAENEDICGWLEVPGLEISYPVVQGEDNDYYLKRTFRKESNGAGSIFMDMRNDRDLTDRNTIIYGHNMKNGSMFGKLKQYRDEEVLKDNPVFYYYTPEQTYQCQIISCRTVNAKESEYPVGFQDADSYRDYLERIAEKSWHRSPFHAKEGDRLMMLSTCTGSKTERFVVQAKIIELSE